MTLTPAEYLELWRSNQPIARRYAQKLDRGDRLSLAVSLSALKQPREPLSTYTSWLRSWKCPPVPTDLANLGWAWNTDGRLSLAHGSVAATVAVSGNQAFTAARRLIDHLRGSSQNLDGNPPEQLALWEAGG